MNKKQLLLITLLGISLNGLIASEDKDQRPSLQKAYTATFNKNFTKWATSHNLDPNNLDYDSILAQDMEELHTLVNQDQTFTENLKSTSTPDLEMFVKNLTDKIMLSSLLKAANPTRVSSSTLMHDTIALGSMVVELVKRNKKQAKL